MIAVISFIRRPSVLLPAPGERPALTKYQEAGQLLGGWLRLWIKAVFGEKCSGNDSKTGRYFCPQTVQKARFACFLSAIEAKS
jgi:hypothetical protein